MDEHVKPKRFNILDYLIIFFLLAAVGFIGYRYAKSFLHPAPVEETVASENSDHVLYLFIQDIRASSADNYLKDEGGDYRFYLAQNDQLLGTFRKIESNVDAEKLYELDNGEFVKVSEHREGEENRVDVVISLRVSGREDAEKGFLLNGSQRIMVHEDLMIYSKYISFNALVVGIE